MSTYQTKTPNPSTTAHQNTGLAKALFEQEQARQQAQMGGDTNFGMDPFTQALARSGGQSNWADQLDPSLNNPNYQKDLEKQKRLEKMRARLHEQINPVNEHQVFAAREKQVKEEIDKLRYELQGLAKDVAAFDKEVELTLMTQVSQPKEGKYYIAFFQKLRAFIMLLRQKIKNAKPWATMVNGKKNKKRYHAGAGIVMASGGYEQTKDVFDTMHHERSVTYGGS